MRAGGFDDRAAAAEAAGWLKARGADVLAIRPENRRVVKSYRVFLPAPSTAEAAASRLSELRRRGVRDIALVRKGPRAGEISLGVYKSRKNMRRRVAALEKLGYPALTAENAGTRRVFAVHVHAGGDRSDLESAWEGRFPGHPIRYVDCP